MQSDGPHGLALVMKQSPVDVRPSQAKPNVCEYIALAVAGISPQPDQLPSSSQGLFLVLLVNY